MEKWIADTLFFEGNLLSPLDSPSKPIESPFSASGTKNASTMCTGARHVLGLLLGYQPTIIIAGNVLLLNWTFFAHCPAIGV
jgi:hypothetical protein